MADDAGVRIRLLGGFEVTVDGRPVAADAWRLRKAKTLVKLLALARGHCTSPAGALAGASEGLCSRPPPEDRLHLARALQ